MASNTEGHIRTEARQDAKKSAKSLQDFFNKFNNDWVMSFASALAFNLITATLPILISQLRVRHIQQSELCATASTGGL